MRILVVGAGSAGNRLSRAIALSVFLWAPAVFAQAPAARFEPENTPTRASQAPFPPNGAQPAYAPNGAPPPYPPGGVPPSYAPNGTLPVYSPPAPPSYALPPPPAPPAPRPGWSLGAGLGFATVESSAGAASALNGLGGIGTARTLAPRLSLERRVSGDTWLVLNGAVSTAAAEEPVTSALVGGVPTRSTIQLTSTQVGLLLGVRQIVAHGVVDISLHAALGFAHTNVGGDDPRADERVAITPGTSSNTFALMGGLAVERQLIPDLALRLSVDLLGGSLSSVDTASSSGGVTTHTKTRARSLGIGISPALLVQFYF